jgi:hypothetical protein
MACKTVPGHDVAWIIAVPQQYGAFELFEQSGAAVHPALCRNCASIDAIVRPICAKS